jgi:hypothetical protein
MSGQHFILQRIHPDYLIHGSKASSFSQVHADADQDAAAPLLPSAGIHRDDSMYQLPATTSSPLPILPEQLEDDHPSTSSTESLPNGANARNHSGNNNSVGSNGHKKSSKSTKKVLTWSEWYETRCTWQNFLLQSTYGLVKMGFLQIVSEEKLWNSHRVRATSSSLYYPQESMGSGGSMSFPYQGAGASSPASPVFYSNPMKVNNAVTTMNSLYAGITPIPISVNLSVDSGANHEQPSSFSEYVPPSDSTDGVEGTYAVAPTIEGEITA